MRAVLDRLDERMREGLIKPTGRTGQGISAVLTVLAFILLMMTRTLNLIADAQMSVRVATAVCLALPLQSCLFLPCAAKKVCSAHGGFVRSARRRCLRGSALSSVPREIMNTIWRTGCKS